MEELKYCLYCHKLCPPNHFMVRENIKKRGQKKYVCTKENEDEIVKDYQWELLKQANSRLPRTSNTPKNKQKIPKPPKPPRINKSYNKEYSRFKKYGIDVNDYNRMFEEQNGCCAICGKHQSETKTILFVDHDHKTKKVRGLLCVACNSGLGNFKDDVDSLRTAADYLERTKTTN